VKRVLVLAYYFPPLGGAGVQRTVKLLKHLTPHYDAVVVTGPDSLTVDWAPPDHSLCSEIPPGTVVRRVPGPQPAAGEGLRGRAERWLGWPSRSSRWWVEGAVAQALPHAGSFDVVYASMSPFETADAADRIARAAGVPWVADLRDPWALDEWSSYPTALHRRLDVRHMRRVLSRASAVILNTPEAERVCRLRFPELAGLFATIPNGWDEDDFASRAPERHDDAFRIVHVGYVHDRPEGGAWSAALRRRLGGETPGLVPRARSHVYLLQAAQRVQQDNDRAIEIHLAGAGAAVETDPTLVRDHGYLSHPDAIALMRSADLLFLPMHDLAPGIRARTVPGKTYEYLASGRPILAALPDGDARDLLSELPTVWLCRPRDVDCIAAGIRGAVRRPRGDHHVPEVAYSYERGLLAGQLVDVLDRVLSATPLERTGWSSTTA
jgi:Glycosyl transferases group 1